MCGALVDDGRDLDHTTFHEMLGEVLDALAVRLAQLEEAQAGPLSVPVWGGATDRMVDSIIASLAVPPGHMRIVLDGPKDIVTPAANALADMLGLEQLGPIVRDAGNPVSEQRAYVVTLDAIHTLANRYAATWGGRARGPHIDADPELAGGPDVDAPEGSGEVRVRLEGEADDVELAVELAEATGFPLNDVSAPYANRRGPRGRVRRYGVVNLTRGKPVPRDQNAPDAMFDDQ